MRLLLVESVRFRQVHTSNYLYEDFDELKREDFDELQGKFGIKIIEEFLENIRRDLGL